MNEGEISTRLGLIGIPACAEVIMIERDIRLAKLTGAHYHVAHVSTRDAVNVIREAKKSGLNITCDTAPPYFSLNESKFDKVVSWLALYHIPNREAYTNKIFNLLHENGMLFIEDLTFGSSFESSHKEMLEKKLFANSLEKYSDYLDTCANVGFEIVEHKDMSLDWESFTKERLKLLQANRNNHEKIHGVEGYSTIEDFYKTVAEGFAENIIGGIRLICKKN